ncbi:MAG: DNA polymerase I, partial [Clostridia bacterium]|nr:DNA polymerase I [Clostridia bacterium]
MKLLVLDGNSILNRAFYGIRQLTTKQGEFTNGIYGFLKMFSRIREQTNPDAVAVAFDLKAPTFRHKMYSEYKANRKGMPPELASQMPVLKELLAAMGYTIVTAEGWEADDILGTLAEGCKANGWECVLATGDRDSLQLVGDGVTVYMLATKMGRPESTAYDTEAIKNEYGVTPRQLIDIKAIQGDSSDNIPGVAGIGQKGAAELVQKFGSLKKIFENIDSSDLKPAHRAKLLANKDTAFLSYDLGTIRTDAPIEINPESYIPAEPDTAKVTALMTRLEFFSILKEMDLKPLAAPADTEKTQAK